MEKHNPPIPTKPCAICGGLTNECQSILGITHLNCFKERPITAKMQELLKNKYFQKVIAEQLRNNQLYQKLKAKYTN